MTPEASNATTCTARAAITEYFSKTNTLTYRDILDKHAKKIELLILIKHRCWAWMWLNVVCQRLVIEKGVKS